MLCLLVLLWLAWSLCANVVGLPNLGNQAFPLCTAVLLFGAAASCNNVFMSWMDLAAVDVVELDDNDESCT
jgi:hypothetical protein